MKTFKFNVSVLFLFISLFIIGGSSFATAADVVQQDTSIQDVPVQTDAANVEVSHITLDKSSYKAGDVIKGSFKLINHSDFDILNASYRVEVGTNYQDLTGELKFTDTFLDAGERQGSINMKVSESKNMSFSYKVPAFISGEKLAIRIDLYAPDGSPIGFGDSGYMSIAPSSDQINIKSVDLVLSDGTIFDMAQGPMIYPDKEPRTALLDMQIENKGKADISIIPKLVVYLQNNISSSKIYPVESTIIKAGETKKVKISLPTMSYKAGVYFAELVLQDGSGVQLASRIGLRYIIGGDIAIVRSISTDKQTLNQNDKFNFSADIFGRSADVGAIMQGKPSSDAKSTVGHADIYVYNEKNEVVAASSESFNIFGETNIEKQYYAKSPATALRANVQIFNAENKMILDYKQNMSVDYDAKVAEAANQSDGSMFTDNFILISGAAILLLLFILIFIVRKRISARSMMMLIILILGSVGFRPSPALAVGCNSTDLAAVKPTVFLQSPTKNQEMVAGQKFYATGYVTYGGCNNSPGDLKITASGPNGDSGSLSYSTSVHTAAAGGHGTWTNGRKAFALGPFYAPTPAGYYRVAVTAHNAINGYGVRDDRGRKINYLCSADNTAAVNIHVSGPNTPPPTNTTGGGGGCPYGYCEITGQCLTQGQTCYDNNPNYDPKKMNDLIKADYGPVEFNSNGLKLTPSIGNPGYTCRISWGDAFKSYDKDTYCTFSGLGRSLSFAPTTTTEVSTTSPALHADTKYTMSCREGTDGAVQTTDAVCRINWNYKEVN